jgi:hypothetical protein
MRRALVLIAVAAFIGIALVDVCAQRYNTGVASALLAVVNLLLLGV